MNTRSDFEEFGNDSDLEASTETRGAYLFIHVRISPRSDLMKN
jgi:hypothetical protein